MVGVVVVAGGASSASANPDPGGCYRVGDPQYAEFRQMVTDMETSGELLSHDADYLRCDPRRAEERVSYQVEVVRGDAQRYVERDLVLDEVGEASDAGEVGGEADAGRVVEGLDIVDMLGEDAVTSAAAEGLTSSADASVAGADVTKAAKGKTSGCRESTRWIITKSIWGKEAFGHRQTLHWCWNKKTKKVSDWSGECSGYTTRWGTVNGWQWDGCSQNDFIGYTLGGSHPGGVHHATQGKFTHMKIGPSVQLRLDIWGHYDSTCDAKYNKTLRHYC